MKGAWLFNNYFRMGHGAIVTGSHTGAWIEDILAENNVMYLTDIGLRAKSTSTIGGVLVMSLSAIMQCVIWRSK